MESANPLERQDMVLNYTRDASGLSRRYYTDTRNLWQKYAGVNMPAYTSTPCDEYEVLYRQVGGFTGTDWNGHNYINLKQGNANGLTPDDLWPDLRTVDDWQQFITDMISRSVRLTNQNNRDADPTHPGWARVPTGSNPCSFCVMLASRGFEYTSEESADFGSSFHNGKCRCVPVCSWGRDKIFGYDQSRYKAMYDHAVQALEDGTVKKLWGDESRGVTLDATNPNAITYAMRRLNPSGLRDGITPERTMPWEQSKRLLSMKSQEKGTKQSWDERQQALGIPPWIEVLECHETVFLERFSKLGEKYEWIPKSDDGQPTNDFHWLSHGVDAELKSLASLQYNKASRRISDAVGDAAKKDVTKDVFVLDYGETKPPEKLLYQLSLYNRRHKSNHIKELWVFDDSGLHQIQLK